MRNRKTSLKFVSKKKQSWWMHLDCCLFFFIFLQINIYDIWLFTLVTQPGVVNSSRPTHTHPSHLSWFRPGPLCSANMTSQYMDGSQWTFWAVISWSVHWHACFMMMTGPLYTTGPSHVAAQAQARRDRSKRFKLSYQKLCNKINISASIPILLWLNTCIFKLFFDWLKLNYFELIEGFAY